MIKAMCRLSCSVCDNMEEQSNDKSKQLGKFRNIEQLKGHLFHQHRLVMCSLCLEGRKVFICEQKLYTRAQLNQHINTGDSEVDGTESERGGFKGHPICEFCKTPFYGENELYSHMLQSTIHVIYARDSIQDNTNITRTMMTLRGIMPLNIEVACLIHSVLLLYKYQQAFDIVEEMTIIVVEGSERLGMSHLIMIINFTWPLRQVWRQPVIHQHHPLRSWSLIVET